MNIKDKFLILEELYLKKNYKGISDYWSKNEESLVFHLNEESSQIAEIISVSYIELEEYKKALPYINDYIDFLLAQKDKGKEDKEYFLDDLKTFSDLKIEIYHKTNKKIREYASVNKYLRYGQDEEMLKLKKELEDVIYVKYVFTNKILMFLTIILLSLFIWDISIFRNNIFLTISLILAIWVVINKFSQSLSRLLFEKILIFITSTIS